MAIDKLNEHYSFTNPASIYDEEALTALELAGRQAKKINEVVEATNHFEKVTIPETVEKDVQKHIDDGDFENAISEHLDGLNERVNNLLGSMTTGSTTMDAEIIDARTNPRSGKKSVNLYTALSAIIHESLSIRNNPIILDANNCLTIGSYWVSSGESWQNVPMYEDTGYPIGGFLLVFNDTGFHTELTKHAHTYQLFLCADGNIYFRLANATGGFFDWEKIPTENNVVKTIGFELTPVKNTLNNSTSCMKVFNGETNIDNTRDTGFYFVGSSTSFTNLPEGENAGVLIVYHGLNDYSIYQIFFSFTGRMYTRNTKVDTTFNPWTKLATVDDIPANTGGDGQSYRYEIVPKTDIDGFEIYQKGNTGYIRYTFGKDLTYPDNRRLLKVEKLDLSRNLENVISDVGHDIEGVVKQDGVFYGGVHGGETLKGVSYFVDGNKIEAFTERMTANIISIYRVGEIQYNGCTIRLKRCLNFAGDIDIGFNVDDNFTSDMPLYQIYGGMLSCYKAVCPYSRDDGSQYKKDITEPIEGTVLNEAGYIPISVEMYGNGCHAIINFKCDNGKNCEYKLYDYGDRYKAYHIYDCAESGLTIAHSFIKFEC